MSLLRKVENFVYKANIGEKDVILRVTESKQRQAEELNAELQWIQYLRDRDASAVAPLRNLDQKWVSSLQDSDGQLFHATCFDYAKGRPVQDALLEPSQTYEFVGKLMAHMHQVAIDWNLNHESEVLARSHWQEERALLEAKKWADFFGDKTVLENAQVRLQSLPQLPHNYGLVHGDVHTGNFFVADQSISLFDFDDSSYHWFMYDLSVPLVNLHFEAYQRQLLEEYENHRIAFLQGYESVRKLSTEDLEQIEWFRSYRSLVCKFWCKGQLYKKELSDSALSWCSDFVAYAEVQPTHL